MLVAIGIVAGMFGVSEQTIRNWCKDGVFQQVERTHGKHRRFNLEEVEKVRGIERQESEKATIIYSRVSSFDQKDDLVRQTAELRQYCERQGVTNVEVLEDIGSGINYDKSGLKKLIKKIVLGEVKHIVIGYKDRLLRFGSEILFNICKLKNIAVTILHEDKEKSFDAQLAQDVLAILTVYCSKIYGRRSHEKKKSAS